MPSIHQVFEARLKRHIDAAADRLVEAQRNVMASHAAKGLLQSGARLKRQAAARNEAVAEIVDWCLVEVADFSKKHGMRPEAHGNQARPALEAFMRSSREKLTFEAFGPAASKAISEILDKADANFNAELDEFAVGAWRPRRPNGETSVTNNNVTVNNSNGVSVQQAGDGAQQYSASSFDAGAMWEALDGFERAVLAAELSQEVRDAIAAEVETIRPQIKKANPSAVILKESLKTLRTVVESAAAGALTPSLLAVGAAAAPLIGLG